MEDLGATSPNIYKGDFEQEAIESGWKVYTKEQVSAYAKQAKGLMEKAETEELTEDEIDTLSTAKAELSTLNKALVLTDEMKEEEIYYRGDGDMEKAKYFKKEGTPGNYKYYYTEAQYKKEKGEKKEDSGVKIQEKGNKTLVKVGNRVRGYVTPSKDGGYSYNIGKPSDVSVSSFSGKEKPLTKDEALSRLKNAINH